MARVKTLKVSEGSGLEVFANFHKSGSIIGMKRKYYGKDALLVRCGSYIYNVTPCPSFYDKAK